MAAPPRDPPPGRLSQELWLLPSNESEQVTQRRWLTLFLVAGSRAVLGTVRSFIKFRAHVDEKVGGGEGRKVEICW